MNGLTEQGFQGVDLIKLFLSSNFWQDKLECLFIESLSSKSDNCECALNLTLKCKTRLKGPNTLSFFAADSMTKKEVYNFTWRLVTMENSPDFAPDFVLRNAEKYKYLLMKTD